MDKPRIFTQLSDLHYPLPQQRIRGARREIKGSPKARLLTKERASPRVKRTQKESQKGTFLTELRHTVTSLVTTTKAKAKAKARHGKIHNKQAKPQKANQKVKDTDPTMRGDLRESHHGVVEHRHIRQDHEVQDRYGHKYVWDVATDGTHKHDIHQQIHARVHQHRVNMDQNAVIIVQEALIHVKEKVSTVGLRFLADHRNTAKEKEKVRVAPEKDKNHSTKTQPTTATEEADQNTQKDHDEAKAQQTGGAKVKEEAKEQEKVRHIQQRLQQKQ